ncbi:zinc finger BED domain-containing protein RICESLEEPER 2-like protein [Tanacetum coccineum]
MVKPIKRKLRKYFENMPPIITCAAALNPCFNVSGVDYLIENISRDLEFADDGFATSLTNINKLKEGRDPIMSSEYEQYIKTDFVRGLQPKDYESYDVLGFWKTKENQFPVLSRMALDILSVQASSVASESAFSTSGRILSIRRTRLTAESLEMYASSDGSFDETTRDYKLSSGAEDDETMMELEGLCHTDTAETYY